MKWMVRYTRIPTNYNDAKNALVEAETADLARQLVQHQLGDFNGVHNYSVETPRPYEPPPDGKIITLNHDPG